MSLYRNGGTEVPTDGWRLCFIHSPVCVRINSATFLPLISPKSGEEGEVGIPDRESCARDGQMYLGDDPRPTKLSI